MWWTKTTAWKELSGTTELCKLSENFRAASLTKSLTEMTSAEENINKEEKYKSLRKVQTEIMKLKNIVAEFRKIQ